MMRPMKRNRCVVGAVAAVVLTLASCSSDDSSPGTTSTGSTEVASVGTVEFQPGEGSTVPVDTLTPPSSVAIDQPATSAEGLTVSIVSAATVQVEAQGPGEVGGPGVAVVIRVVNATKATVDLTGAKVTIATGAEQTPAAPAAASSTPFASIAAPGDTAEATYVASVPADATLVTITVTVVPGGAPVVFTGSL